MDILAALRALGRELEHEPPPALVLQRGRLAKAIAARR